jgi:outer membrane protein OmpA-like peptidoglycan-associated protein
MRRIFLIAALLVPQLAAAQNYVPANRYNNPDVVVNFDILGGGVTALLPHYPQPAYQPPMAAPQPMMMQPHVTLTPPPARMMAPLPPMPAPQPMQAAPAPRPIEDMRNVHLAPAKIDLMDAPRDLPTPNATIVPPQPVLEQRLDTPVAEKSNASRQLLAQARAEAAESEAIASPVKKSAARSPVLFDDVLPPPPQDELAPTMPAKIVGSQKASQAAPMPLNMMDTQDLPPVEKAEAKPAATPDDFEAYRLFFTPEVATLAPEEDKVLRGLITKLKRDDKLRVQILAFAASTPETASAARRLSLTRALSVRSAIVSDGINADRLDVRAMGAGDGDKTQPPDRVDLIFKK